jgi:type II secretory pathway component PulF
VGSVRDLLFKFAIRVAGGRGVASSEAVQRFAATVDGKWSVMRTATLNEFLALNDQLAALVQADVPIHLDLASPRASFAESLERLNAVIARRMGQGATLGQALEEEPTVTPSYRTLVQLGLQCGDFSVALAGAARLAESVDAARQAVRASLVYPLIVGSLAYVGLLGFCGFFVPSLEGMYESIRIPAGSGLRGLQMLRDTVPFWVAIPPAALVLLLVATRFRKGKTTRTARWLPGADRLLFEQQCASFAETLAAFLEAGVPLDDALRLAAGVWDDPQLQNDVRALSADPATAAVRAARQTAPLPPFLRWALWHADDAIGRPRALRMAAKLYRESSARRVKRLRVLAPLVTCVTLAGGVTLLYGLALFLPVVQMLKAIAY